MEHLHEFHEELSALLAQLSNREEFQARLESLVSVYPFNQYEYVISTLLAMDVLTLDDYRELRRSYISRNQHLHLFERSPRSFGGTWAESHLRELVPSVQTPSDAIDPDYSGQYDLYMGGIRIEVKASRAVDRDSRGPLYVKALASDSTKRFLMNFQQVQPRCFDVIVWIAVWRDVIRYWVLSSYEVETNSHYSRGQHLGNVGEGQLHVRQDNIQDFTIHEVKSNRLEEAIREAYDRQVKAISMS